MGKLLFRLSSAALALLIMLSVLSAPISAVELTQEDEAEVAQTGAINPVITSLAPCQEGIKMEWEPIDGINLYRVYRWYDDGRGWVAVKDTSLTSYIDTAVASGNKYRYRVVGINSSGAALTLTVSAEIDYTAPAHITDAEAASDGIRLYWKMESGVSKVAVYRKNGGNWQQIATTSDSSYLDKNVSAGNEYTYTVRALTSSGAYMHEYYDETGIAIRYVATPVVSARTAVGGVDISWNAVEGAEGYRVFYRNSKGGWSRLGDTTETSMLDKDVSSGHTYTYTVRCISADGEYYTSYCDTAGKSATYIAAPVLKSAAAVNDGILISWDKSNGAAKYRVFYKNSKDQWARLGDTASTYLLDEDVSSGVTYTYTVRCMNASGDYISSFYDEGISGLYLSAPAFSVSNGEEGVDISWPAVKGAENYRVYYYGSKGWTKLTDTKETSVTDSDVSSGYNYTYTVRCINADGTAFTSGHLTGKSVKYYAAPEITKLENAEDGVRITWSAVSGVQKYRVYYYGKNGWTKLTDTASTSYLDQDVLSGKTYTYTVRCLNSAGNAFLSYFKPGVKKEFIAAPDFKLTRNEKSITISWNKVEGAALYRVYYYGTKGWTKLTDTKETKVEDKDVSSGYTYTYTVRCLNAEATAFTSDFRAGKSIKLVDMPHITSVSNTTEGVEISWGAAKGASKYRVYYKDGSGWNRIGDTTSTSFVHESAESGKTYTYTVRCINASATEFESSFDPEGKSIRYIAAPKNIKAESYKNGIKISWTPSAGAEKYRVYYYGSKGWTRLTETTESSVIDNVVSSGYTYRYTVRCITSDGKSFTSDCYLPGASCKFTTMPVINETDCTKDGIQLSWSKSPGAEKYRVYYYGSRGWTKLTETTSTTVLDTDVASGYTYRYTVRCITSDGSSFTSDCDTDGTKVFFVSAPKLLNMETESDRVTITWSKPSGATKFRVYKKVSGSWTRLADTASNSYTDKSVYVGYTYTYTVRVISNDGTRFYSGFDPTGFIVTVVTGVDGFRYYDQTQYNYPYGDDTIADSGCGPTSFAMVASTLTGKTITPIDAVSWCGNSYYIYNVGTMWNYFNDAAERFGVTLVTQTYDIDTAISALKQGKLVINSQSAGRFTKGGHFIVLAGITSSGKIIVYDPNGGNHYVGTSFTRAEIDESGTSYWIFDK